MKIGVMFGNPETTTGGNALKFYSSVRLDIRKKEAIKKGDVVVGNVVKIKVVKNKVAPPFREIFTELIFGEGIPIESEIISFATEYKILEKTGSWYSYNGDRLGQGRENVKALLKENRELL